MKVDWQKVGGLLPVIVQEMASNEVLMLAYMNEEALNLTLESGFAHYFSRTKNRIWKKGEESGNTQILKSAFLDCDNDTLLIKVEQIGGVACHTGEKSCFFKELNLTKFDENLTTNLAKTHAGANTKKLKYSVIDELYHIICERKLENNPEKSYVARLLSRGDNGVLKKICEEAGELVLALKDLDRAEKYANLKQESFGEHRVGEPKYDVIYEASDLVFHMLVALAKHNIHPDQIHSELARRNGISGLDEKNSRKK
ncbi:bifunctional phosphoribosyl-AMP cyclohydrolase/phosphoribosyl-ATP diphosphatase HisIE [Campylobacter geochelonis]|uniref:bifunctional phosphoribosyl-AMP cyclohydrolase/phosphoribosyl-ATP diphosphatase HisIE n=1 Tax=Campylobacter geochelonis TaxID=1780362 RepID=UPI00094C55BB